MFNSLSSSFTNFHRKITSNSKPFFPKTLNNQKLPRFPTSNHFELLFKLLDSNGDGKISAKELRRLLRRLGYQKLKAAEEAEELVREMDSDGDGLVAMDEFLVAVSSNSNNGGSDDRAFKEEEDDDVLMEAFLIFDADKNGLISAEELRRILNKFGWRKCGLNDCRRMIEGVDKDGDGFVNFQDFRLMMRAKDNEFWS